MEYTSVWWHPDLRMTIADRVAEALGVGNVWFICCDGNVVKKKRDAERYP
jgi:hypothetical protein